MFGATSWALRRLLKFILKRNLKHVIATEIDLEQLNVQLGSGVVELKEILLCTEYLNEQLGSLPFRITEGFVGSVRAEIPFASLYSDSCVIKLDEVLLTLEAVSRDSPAPLHPFSLRACEGVEQQSRPPPPREEARDQIASGIQSIASGIESLLQRLSLQATNVTVHLLVPRLGAEGVDRLVVALGRVGYVSRPAPAATEVEAPAPARSEQVYIEKDVSVRDVRVSLQSSGCADCGVGDELCSPTGTPRYSLASSPPASLSSPSSHLSAPCASPEGRLRVSQQAAVPLLQGAGAGGCSAEIQLQLLWHSAQQVRPHIRVSVDLEPLSLRLDARLVAAAARFAERLRPSGGAAEARAGGPKSLVRPEVLSPPGPPAAGEWGSRSLIESMMLPDCQGLALQALHEREEETDEEDEFFDAQSAASSLYQDASSSSLSAESTAAMRTTLSRMQDLTSSVRRGLATAEWEMVASCPSCSIGLDLGGQGADRRCPRAGADGADCLSIALAQVQLSVQAEDRSHTMALVVRRLYAAESAACPDAEEPERRRALHQRALDLSQVPGRLGREDGSAIPATVVDLGGIGVQPSSTQKGVSDTLSQLQELQERDALNLSTAPFQRVTPLFLCGEVEDHKGGAGPPAFAALVEAGSAACLQARAAVSPVLAWMEMETLERVQQAACHMASVWVANGGGQAVQGCDASAEALEQGEPHASGKPAGAMHLSLFIESGCFTMALPPLGPESDCTYLTLRFASANRNVQALLQGIPTSYCAHPFAVKAAFQTKLPAEKGAMCLSHGTAEHHSWHGTMSLTTLELLHSILLFRGGIRWMTFGRKQYGGRGCLCQACQVQPPKGYETLSPVLDEVMECSTTFITAHSQRLSIALVPEAVDALRTVGEQLVRLLPQPLSRSIASPQTALSLSCDEIVLEAWRTLEQQPTATQVAPREATAHTFCALAQGCSMRFLGSLCEMQGANAFLLKLQEWSVRNENQHVLLFGRPRKASEAAVDLQLVVKPRGAASAPSLEGAAAFPTRSKLTAQARPAEASSEHDVALALAAASCSVSHLGGAQPSTWYVAERAALYGAH
ncbi:hypothetical protein H632_c741p0, partial [Helicosporidium sp. ATCC 50920]